MKLFRKNKETEPNYCGFWASKDNNEAFLLYNRHKKHDNSITYDCLYASPYNMPIWYDEEVFVKDIDKYNKIGIADFRKILKENCYQEEPSENDNYEFNEEYDQLCKKYGIVATRPIILYKKN